MSNTTSVENLVTRKPPFPKGAEWRKWDLHFHTPSSYDYKNKSITNSDLLDALVEKGISVVAVTDHHFMDIDRIRDLREIGLQKVITVLPGIEFLSDARGSEPVHFIGIFPEDCQLDFVWGQIQNKTAISKMVSEKKAANEVYCDLIETINLVHELGGIVSIHSGNKHGTIETITNSLDHTMAQKEDIAHHVDIYELGNADDQNGYRKIVFPKIRKVLPMLICSDNHNIKDYQLKTNCWLKADPTFEGLKQIINEPDGRVFIGDKPPLFDRISKNRTKYIKELSIAQVDSYDERHGVWFKDIFIPLNSELVAIIGNKGSGKSALGDVLALCSNYQPNDKDFSFLTSGKFKKNRLAENFNAILVWESNKQSPMNLGAQPENTELDVKYLPQGQFERLTNEIRTAEEFQREIESVVFSHVPDSEKLGAKSFAELIDKTTSSVNQQLELLRDDVRNTNKSIIDLEHKATPAYKAETENKLAKKREELSALVEPPSVSDPNEDPEKKTKNEAVNKNINELKENIQQLQMAFKAAEGDKKSVLEALQKLKNFKSEVQQKKTEIDRFVSEKEIALVEFDLDINKLISITTDFTSIDALILDKKAGLTEAKKQLGELESSEEEKSFPAQLEAKEGQLKGEKSKLDAEQQRYQQYLSERKAWEKEKTAIIGSSDKFDTLKYYEHELNYLTESLPADLGAKYESRREIVGAIFDEKQKVIAVYKDARNRLEKIIENNQDTLKDYSIKVDVALVKKADFNTRFLDFILQNKMGSFHSKDGGEAQLIKLSAEVDFDKKECVIELLDGFIDALRHDKRSSQSNTDRAVADQVKDMSGFYEYLFSLEFLENNYQLKQGDKNLDQLSPGERGALLLVFYLLLDNSDIPLIIDQPEDNLDNHSVATILVPFIRKAKEKRQIIMVTHNPNLAVVSDAEQVIYVELDKGGHYVFSTISGSIEDKMVNKKIVDVLEGTMPAFNIRKRKYYE